MSSGSPLSSSTTDSLNRRRPMKTEHPQSNTRNIPSSNSTMFDGAAGGKDYVKREHVTSQHHDENQAQEARHQQEQTPPAQQQRMRQEQRTNNRHDGESRISGYLRMVKERFPDNPKIYDDFLVLMDTHRSARDALPHVSRLFRRAPNLVHNYVKLADILDAWWFHRRRGLPADPPLVSSPVFDFDDTSLVSPLHTHPQPSSQHLQLPRQHSHNPRVGNPFSDSESDYSSRGSDNVKTEKVENNYADPRRAGGLSVRQDVKDVEENADMQKLLTLPEIDIPPELRRQTPREMACTLMEHQKISLTWLIQQEQDSHKKGGLLADTMGLGKTVQALALILARPSRDPAFKTTLVVTPVSLLSQWEREIQTKVKPLYKLKTLILHGPLKRGMTVSKLLSYDVVLTTYGKIASEYKSLAKPGSNKRPLLLAKDARFHRIILDEAHNIKNQRSGRSMAVCMLNATYRLCMTGTPFMNNIAEIFSLIRFLRIAPYHSWERFNHDIAKPIKNWDEDERSDAMVKLQALFRSITLRRTKSSMLDGKRIIELPDLSRERSEVEFDADQRAFYDALEKEQRLEFNKYLQVGIDSKNYAHIFVLLLRLRQACCHPHLIKNHCIPDGTQLTPEEMVDLALKLKDQVIARIESQEAFQCPLCNTNTENPIIIYPCGHHICGGCFTSMMEMRHLGVNIEDFHESACPQDYCSTLIQPDRVLCYNFFREAHGSEGSGDEASGEGADDLDEDDYPEGQEDDVDAQGNLKDFVVSDDHQDDEKAYAIKDEGSNHHATFHTTPGKHRQLADTTDVFQSPEESRENSTQQQESTERNTADDSDNDSLPSLETIYQQVFRGKLLDKSRSIESQDDGVQAESGSGNETDQGATSKDKRKRNNDDDDEMKMPRKQMKRDDKSTNTQGMTRGETFKSMAALKKEASQSAAAKAKYLQHLRKGFVSSAKIDKTTELLRAIRERDPGEKTLVFSLWTSFLDLLEIPLRDQGFRYTRYDGSMSPQDRDAAVAAFMERPGVGVMLVSLMAGNAGLNLTAATQVIILEPFWNPFVEDQATDRAHRIGQKRPVTVHRVLVAGTVEDRIQELQEKKRRLVSAALSEEGAQNMSRLSTRELKGLFGIR